MALRLTPNPRAAGRLSLSANQAARMSSIVSVDWSAITNKPDLNDFSDILSPALGGTGVDNTSTLTITGSYGITFTLTAITSLTLPTTGTLATLAGVETLSNKTLVAPALGTPASGVATNLTGTATGLTAGTATNAVNSGISNDTTTNATMFPVWVTANSGNLPIKVSSTSLTWNPSTKVFRVTGGVLRSDSSGAGFYLGDRGADSTNDWLHYAQSSKYRYFNVTDSADWFALTKVTGVAEFFSTTDSSSTSTGGVVLSGGLGVAKAIFGGSTLNVAGVATVASGTATPAAGSTSARLLLGTTAGFGIYYGSGAPTVSAAQGSIYLRSDGTQNNRLYINTNGSTTWTAFNTTA